MQRRKVMIGSWRRQMFIIVVGVFKMYVPIRGLKTQHASLQNKYSSRNTALERTNKHVIYVGRVSLQREFDSPCAAYAKANGDGRQLATPNFHHCWGVFSTQLPIHGLTTQHVSLQTNTYYWHTALQNTPINMRVLCWSGEVTKII